MHLVLVIVLILILMSVGKTSRGSMGCWPALIGLIAFVILLMIIL